MSQAVKRDSTKATLAPGPFQEPGKTLNGNLSPSLPGGVTPSSRQKGVNWTNEIAN